MKSQRNGIGKARQGKARDKVSERLVVSDVGDVEISYRTAPTLPGWYDWAGVAIKLLSLLVGSAILRKHDGRQNRVGEVVG